MRSDFVRKLLFVLAACLSICLLAIGCGTGGASKASGSSSSPTPTPSPAVLFADNFTGSFPGANWIIVSGSPVINQTVGNPPPSLELPKCTSNNGSSCTLIQSAVNPFNTSNGLSFSFDVGFPAALGPPGGGVFINTQGGGAFAEVFFSTGTNTVLYCLPNNNCVQNPINADNNFHAYSLVIDASGNATWRRDGIQQATATGASSNALVLKVNGANNNFGPLFVGDVKVTSP